MNERIRELAEQAWDDTKEKFGSFVDDGGEVDFTFLHEWTEKFAELIVRECAQFVDYRLTNPDGASMAWCDGSDIKQHFGVEE